MVESSQTDDEILAVYSRIAKMVMDEALSIGFPPEEAREQALKFVGFGITKPSPPEPPKKPA